MINLFFFFIKLLIPDVHKNNLPNLNTLILTHNSQKTQTLLCQNKIICIPKHFLLKIAGWVSFGSITMVPQAWSENLALSGRLCTSEYYGEASPPSLEACTPQHLALYIFVWATSVKIRSKTFNCRHTVQWEHFQMTETALLAVFCYFIL